MGINDRDTSIKTIGDDDTDRRKSIGQCTRCVEI